MAEQLHPEDIYQTLEHDIVTLKIKPGETISENQLCKRFGISRTPVRAALQRLEQNGFVQIIPCKGTIVTPHQSGYRGSDRVPAHRCGKHGPA